MDKYHRFYIIFTMVVIGFILPIPLFNIAIDPYGIMNSPSVVGVNQSKPAKVRQMRLFKSVDVTRLKPITIFLGTSRGQFLDPNHPALAKIQPAYNLSLLGANMHEQMRYFQHAIANNPKLKEVIIEVDFFAFNTFNESPSDFQEERLEKTGLTLQDASSINFSLDTFNTSRETLIFNKNRRPNNIQFIKGMYINKNKPSKSKLALFQSSIFVSLDDKKAYSDYDFNKQFFSNYKTIVDTCKERAITLKVFITSSHATDMESIRAAGLWPTFEQWKREVVNLAPLWDFSGYNSITTEPIGDKMKYFEESLHPTKEADDLIINRIFQYEEERVPADFGVFTTATNIESNLEKIRADREVWAKNNPDVVKLVQDIKREVEEKKSNTIKK